MGIHLPFHPIFPKEFNWVRSANGPISTTKCIGGTVFITAPADTLGILGPDWKLGHVQDAFFLPAVGFPYAPGL
ncbi:MAG TPA: hypothetical protein VN684_11605 [Terriglobales bacterium]|nr:hypothetical protein [Terriglobales bacterium]